MKAIYSLTLALLPLITAAGQLRQERFDAIIDDPKSCFHAKQIPQNYNRNQFGIHSSGCSRVVSIEKDTIVCETRMAWGNLDYKNDIGRIELIVEGQNNGNKNVFSGESNFKKLRRHMRLKAKAYGRYNTVPGKPYVLEVTAHIDFFPFKDYMTCVRYTTKRRKYLPRAKYGIYTKRSDARYKAKLAKEKRKEKKWQEERKPKEDKWFKNYLDKYKYIVIGN